MLVKLKKKAKRILCEIYSTFEDLFQFLCGWCKTNFSPYSITISWVLWIWKWDSILILINSSTYILFSLNELLYECEMGVCRAKRRINYFPGGNCSPENNSAFMFQFWKYKNIRLIFKWELRNGFSRPNFLFFEISLSKVS